MQTKDAYTLCILCQTSDAILHEMNVLKSDAISFQEVKWVFYPCINCYNS